MSVDDRFPAKGGSAVSARNRAGVPHALAYLLDDDAASARLAGSFGLRVAASHSLEVLVHPGGVAVVTLGVSSLVDVVTILHPSTDVAKRGGTPL